MLQIDSGFITAAARPKPARKKMVKPPD